jgi:hypothetical protein
MSDKDLYNFSKLLFCNQGGNMELLDNHTHNTSIVNRCDSNSSSSFSNILQRSRSVHLDNKSNVTIKRSSSWYLNMLNWHFK